MIATWLGGPNDGAQIELQDGTTEVAIYLPLMVPHFHGDPIDPDEDIPSITRHLPVVQTGPGRWVIRW